MERYKNATKDEKAIFTLRSKEVSTLTHIVERNRELKGEKSWVKYQLNLKANNPHIHVLEFGIKKGEVANVRLVVAKPTLKSDFYKAMEKLGFKGIYGGIVLHIPCEEKELPTLLAKIDKAAEASEEIELDAKRTYCDPPAGWVKDRTGKEGIVKEEAPAAE
jgi:hypothetical protein